MTLLDSPNPEVLPASPDEEGLTHQERMFISRYLMDYDERQAAQAVGLPLHEGLSLLRSPRVVKEIKDRVVTRETLSLLGTDFAATQWLKILPKLFGDEAVPMVTKHGTEYMAKKFFASESVKALIEISHASGLSKPPGFGANSAPVNIQLNFGGLMTPQPVTVVNAEPPA